MMSDNNNLLNILFKEKHNLNIVFKAIIIYLKTTLVFEWYLEAIIF